MLNIFIYCNFGVKMWSGHVGICEIECFLESRTCVAIKKNWIKIQTNKQTNISQKKGSYHIEAIKVVNVSVLPDTMKCIFVHGDLRPIKHRRLVHVIPDVLILHGTLDKDTQHLIKIQY